MGISGFVFSVCGSDLSSLNEEIRDAVSTGSMREYPVYRFLDLPGGIPLYNVGAFDEQSNLDFVKALSAALPHTFISGEIVDTMGYEGAWIIKQGEVVSGFEAKDEYTEIVVPTSSIVEEDAFTAAFQSLGLEITSEQVRDSIEMADEPEIVWDPE